METSPQFLVPLVLLFFSLYGSAAAQGTKPLSKKPPEQQQQQPAPHGKPAQHGIKGTVQMAGDNGKLGVTYTIGKGSEAVNFTARHAEYVTRVVLRDEVYTANEDEKLLVLHYTAHNPNARENDFNWSTLHFTAVDSQNVNREGVGLAGKDGTAEKYDIRLKPAQKIEVFTVFRLPADVSVPKIIVQHGDDLPVLRLYLAAQEIQGVPSAFADPQDVNAAIVRADVPAEMNIFYPLCYFDVKVINAIYLTGNLGTLEPEEGTQFYVVTLVIKNATFQKQSLDWAILDSKLKTTDGENVPRESLLMLKRSESIDGELEPGEESIARFYYQIPKDTEVASVSIWEGEKGRRLVYTVKGGR